MPNPSQDVEMVVRCLLDAMRNSHMRLVLNDPAGAVEFAHEAKHFHARLDQLFAADAANRAAAGQIMRDVIGQRCQGLLSLAQEAVATPQPADALVAFVHSPLDPVRSVGGR